MQCILCILVGIKNTIFKKFEDVTKKKAGLEELGTILLKHAIAGIAALDQNNIGKQKEFFLLYSKIMSDFMLHYWYIYWEDIFLKIWKVSKM